MKKCLIIVAHPDDETIWMGGTILKNPDWNWTIFSLCRRNDADRAPKFKKVCEHYKASSIISDLDDEYHNELSVQEVKDIIMKNLQLNNFDLIFTHGENGEYGHIRHKDIHNAARDLVSDGTLNCRELYFFDYLPGKEKAPHDPDLSIPVPNKKSDWFVKLTKDEHQQKLKIITDIYGFKHPIFETLACAKEEAFRKFVR